MADVNIYRSSVKSAGRPSLRARVASSKLSVSSRR